MRPGVQRLSDRFEQLADFVSNKMRMLSHLYQPVVLTELLQSGGSASISVIAKALLIRNVSQIEYYEHIAENMVGKVLTWQRVGRAYE